MMKNRIPAMILAFLAAISLSACRSAGTAETQPAADGTEQTVTLPQETEKAPDLVFAETVLIEDENCTVSITGIEDDSIWGYTLKAYLENKTDINLMFSLEDVSVNGFMCDPFWACSVSAGMKSHEDISFLADDFRRNGISAPSAIRFTLNVYDADNYTAEHLLSQSFTLYPLGEEAVEEYHREPAAGETVLFDNAYASMIVTGTDPDNIWGYGLCVYLENKTDKPLMFSASDVAVNGFMCDPYWSVRVAPGMRSNTVISWFEDDFRENGITDVESIVLPITVSDAEDWMAEDLVNESFTLNP